MSDNNAAVAQSKERWAEADKQGMEGSRVAYALEPLLARSSILEHGLIAGLSVERIVGWLPYHSSEEVAQVVGAGHARRHPEHPGVPYAVRHWHSKPTGAEADRG